MSNYYQSYLAREPPRNLGTVEWPNAKDGSLAGKNFLVTGVLETIEHNDVNNLIRDCGGHVMSVVSPKLTYLIVGRDAGPKKLETASAKGIATIDEGGFYQYLKETIDDFDGPVTAKTENKPAPKKAKAAGKADGDVKPKVTKKSPVKRTKKDASDDEDEEPVKPAKKATTKKPAKKAPPKKIVKEESEDEASDESDCEEDTKPAKRKPAPKAKSKAKVKAEPVSKARPKRAASKKVAKVELDDDDDDDSDDEFVPRKDVDSD
ncbi:Replication factor C subunit 1 [Halotydeus destructor]|nr:Replication factor C subunit 1 [Halotydeus destructor]